MNNQEVISIRQIQRNYRKLVDRVKETGQAVYLGARLKPEAVLLDVETFESLQARAARKKTDWKRVKKRLDLIVNSGRQGVSLSKFIYADRQRH